MLDPIHNSLLALAEIDRLIRRGALFVVNHSGGKDSQAMMAIVAALVPRQQIFVVHAHLPDVEWPGTEEHVYATIGDLEATTVLATKTFFEMVDWRGMWPSPKYRQCTSDLKRGPIEKLIRQVLRDRGLSLIVNCMGMRAQESPARSKRPVLAYSKRNSKAGREWYEWLPIHELTVEQVFDTIAAAGQKPHWAYAAGMTRLSCCFCIMASRQDLTTAARLRPGLFTRYVEKERELGMSMLMPDKHGPRFLEDVTGIPAFDKKHTSEAA